MWTKTWRTGEPSTSKLQNQPLTVPLWPLCSEKKIHAQKLTQINEKGMTEGSMMVPCARKQDIRAVKA